MLQDFKTFILRGNLVELATAFVMGVAFSAVVSGVVEGIVNPVIALVAGQPDFSALAFSIRDTEFPYGIFVGALINFLLTAAVVFFLIIKPMNALQERLITRGEESPAPATRQCTECLSEVPHQARRCAFCTSALQPA